MDGGGEGEEVRRDHYAVRDDGRDEWTNLRLSGARDLEPGRVGEASGLMEFCDGSRRDE